MAGVHQPGDQGSLGTDDDKIDVALARQGHQPVQIVGGDGHAFRLFGDAGIAGRAYKRLAQGRGGDGPTQGVLAAARSDHQDTHGVLSLPRLVPRRRSCIMAARISPSAP